MLFTDIPFSVSDSIGFIALVGQAVLNGVVMVIVGILLAFGLCAGLAKIIQVPFNFNLQINVIAFLFSAAVGVLFGYTPARRAARLNPIDALRHE